MSNEIRFCEFTGDDDHDHDEVGHKQRCDHIAFTLKDGGQYICGLSKKPLGSKDGWRVCADGCTQPIQIKVVRK